MTMQFIQKIQKIIIYNNIIYNLYLDKKMCNKEGNNKNYLE